MRRCIDHNRKTQAWPEAKRKSFRQGRKPESGTTTTCAATFLPSEERQSTAALAPIASWPSILVSESNKQLELLRLLLVQVESKFRVADRADPPRYRANFSCRSFSPAHQSKAVERPTASVKQTRKDVATRAPSGIALRNEPLNSRASRQPKRQEKRDGP